MLMRHAPLISTPSATTRHRSTAGMASALVLGAVTCLSALGCGDDGGSLPPGTGIGATPNQNQMPIPTPAAPTFPQQPAGGGPVSPASPGTTDPVQPVTTLTPGAPSTPAGVVPTNSVPAPTTVAPQPTTPATTATPVTPEATAPTATQPATVTPVTPAEPEPDAPQGNPDAEPVLPQTANGWFNGTSNFYGFQGSWYCFDDGEVETSCVTDEPPFVDGEGMCLTGATIVDETYAAWGAGIGASLNDDDGTKLAFDAEAAGIKGFKFTISGDLGGASLKFQVPRTSKDSESPPEYEITKAGTYSVEFGDVEPPAHDTVGTEHDPAKLYELKWQISGGNVEAEYEFCVTNVEPI